MYVKFWKVRIYVKAEVRLVKKAGKVRHAHELARTARVATYIYDTLNTTASELGG